jgi:hypothetical protein
MARSRLSTLEGCAGNTLLQQQMNKQQSKAFLEIPAKSAVMKILMYFNVSGWVDSRTCPNIEAVHFIQWENIAHRRTNKEASRLPLARTLLHHESV